MEVTLYKLSKRRNSTKKPSSSGITLECYIKDNVAKGQLSNKSGTEFFLTHPTIFLAGIYSQYNYAKLLDRYYFITDIQFTINEGTIMYLEEDVLATYKDDILDTTQKVIYCSTNYNLDIDDIRNQDTEDVSHHTTSYDLGIFTDSPSYSTGTYLLTVNGGDMIATTYLLTFTQLMSVGQALNDTFSDIYGTQINSGTLSTIANFFSSVGEWVTDSVMEYFTNAANAICDLKWTPINLSSMPYAGYSSIYLNAYATGVNAKIAGRASDRIGFTVDISHYQDNYLKGNRWSSYGYYFPFCGSYQLSAEDVYNNSKLRFYYGIDGATGDIAGEVIGDDTMKRVGTFAGSTASSLIYGNTSANTQGSAIMAVANAILALTVGGLTAEAYEAEAATSNSLASSLARIGAVQNAVSQVGHVQQQSAVTGGKLSTSIGYFSGTNVEVYRATKIPAESVTAHKNVIGLPTYKTLKLSSCAISGSPSYVQCMGASMPISALANERDAITKYLNSGFFIN